MWTPLPILAALTQISQEGDDVQLFGLTLDEQWVALPGAIAILVLSLQLLGHVGAVRDLVEAGNEADVADYAPEGSYSRIRTLAPTAGHE